MPSYTVILPRDVTESTIVTVEADSPATAQDAALRKIEEADDPPTWEIDDYTNGDVYCTGVGPA